MVEGYNSRVTIEQEQKRQEIYVSALLISQFVWAKGKRPSYEKVFGSKANHEEMTDEEMLRKVEALNAMFGGIDERKAVD